MVLYVPLRPLQIMTNFCKFHRASDIVLAKELKRLFCSFQDECAEGIEKFGFVKLFSS